MPTGPAASSLAPAGLVRRGAALGYDCLLAGALIIVLGFALLPLSVPAGGGSGELALLTPAARAGLFACLFAVCGAYCLWSWSGGRRTLGMKAWGLALRAAGGAPPTATQALLRYLAWWIGPACAIGAYAALAPYRGGAWASAALGVNYLWALADPGRQFLHDRLAGTRIVLEARRAG